MSLLPGQILPETEPIATKNGDGSLTLTHNWYLLLYNLTSKVLGPTQAPAGASTITVEASPFIYTTTSAGNVSVTGGTVSSIMVLRQGIQVPTGMTSGLIPVSPGDQVIVTYSVAPSMTFLPA
jgi:hypothetical protein